MPKPVEDTFEESLYKPSKEDFIRNGVKKCLFMTGNRHDAEPFGKKDLYIYIYIFEINKRKRKKRKRVILKY